VAFHTNDPRIGTGTAEPTLVAPSRASQLVAHLSTGVEILTLR
jgi:hypothetical protein